MAEKAKYIDVKELSIILDTMKNPDSEFATDDYIDGFSDGISAAIKELEAFPTADVAPVRHGYWIEQENWALDDYYYTCSACGTEWITIEGTPEENDMDFCPHCGAKMDEEDV